MKRGLNPKYMRLAIKAAEKIIRSLKGGPFGACIVRSGKILAVAGNTVFKDDATCHAEVNAIRMASKKLKTYDLSGCEIYTTTEPCPMCFAAIHWSGIRYIIFGSSIADAAGAGFNEICISAKRLKREGKSPVRIRAGFLKEECGMLYKKWKAIEKKKAALIDHESPYFY
jgi:tRNA(Arg) A34 adenosine deaminase TadA